jgi:hypothetical protein
MKNAELLQSASVRPADSLFQNTTNTTKPTIRLDVARAEKALGKRSTANRETAERMRRGPLERMVKEISECAAVGAGTGDWSQNDLPRYPVSAPVRALTLRESDKKAGQLSGPYRA